MEYSNHSTIRYVSQVSTEKKVNELIWRILQCAHTFAFMIAYARYRFRSLNLQFIPYRKVSSFFYVTDEIIYMTPAWLSLSGREPHKNEVTRKKKKNTELDLIIKAFHR